MPTRKISVTIDDTDLSWLRRRANAEHGGNLSAAFSEAARALRKQEALRAFLEKEGVPRLGSEDLVAIQNEWKRRRPRRARKRRAA